jgi:iron complex outermembrane receptor protein
MRHAQLHRRLLALAIATALPGLAVANDATTVATADTAARDVVALDQVVVTAQKRATNLQDTPISVSVVHAKH